MNCCLHVMYVFPFVGLGPDSQVFVMPFGATVMHEHTCTQGPGTNMDIQQSLLASPDACIISGYCPKLG